MSTPSRTAQASWRRRSVGLLIAGVLLASVSCSGPADVGKAENSTVISYSGAVSRLRGLDPTEVEEQLRDWARIGLASHLELDTAQLRNAAYDTVPVRDAAFADLARQPTGPGRALFDGRGVLHVLVARGDPHEARTIGLLIDQYRADAGTDPPQVQLEHYQLHSGAQTIELTPEKPTPTAEVRSAHGFVTMRVDEIKGLTDFLARTRHLSWLELRGSEVWAGGWNWPDVPAAPLDVEDVSTIQRGYLQPPSERRPGFSLDPGPKETRDDILAVIPGLSPDLADRLVSHNWAGSRFPSADRLGEMINGPLFHDIALPAELGLPSDRTQLWALYGLLKGQPAYSQARNDGRLEGTKVGMTLFYTDKVAKDWVSGVGSGVPTKAVGGFISDPEAPISWSHCDPANAPKFEYGRLWFGQNDSSFTFDGDRISIGALATRLFSRSEENGGTEVEPSFAFGRGLRWWDRHFQAVADYEPQYQRLEQVMRWSGALDWLASRARTNLPQLDDAAIRSDLRFKDWYAQNNELRERSPIRFVTPPSARHEAVMAEPSKVFPNCGFLRITGGVSLGDLIERQGGRNLHPEISGEVRRGGLFDETSRFDPVTGSGQIKQESLDSGGHVGEHVQRTLSTSTDGHAVIDITADGRRVNSLGGVKVSRPETATRQLGVDLAADRGQIVENVQLQGQELGRLTARKNVEVTRAGVDTVSVMWRPGLVDRFLRGLESFQDRLVSAPAGGLPSDIDGIFYSLSDVKGRILAKIGGPDAPWGLIASDLTPPGDALAFRVGAPDPGAGGARILEGRLSPGPVLPPRGVGMEVTPATGDHSAQAHLAGPPGDDAPTVQVITTDKKSTTVREVGDPLWVPIDDPILGFNGTADGAALLRGYRPVAEARRRAAAAHDGRFRAVRLGKDGEDGVALAGTDGVILVPADHSFADRVRQAIGYDPSVPEPLIHLEGDRALHVDPSPLTIAPSSLRHTTLNELRNTAIGEIYLHRSMITIDNGVIIPDPLRRDTHVTVREAVVAERPSAESTATQPDIRVHGGGEWWRVPGTGAGPYSNVTPSSTPLPNGPGGGVGALLSGPILLVCPDTNEKLPGCDQ